MIKLTVLYGHPLVPDDFEAYYRATHRPLLADVQGIQRAELTLFCTQADGSLPAYHRMADKKQCYAWMMVCQKCVICPVKWVEVGILCRLNALVEAIKNTAVLKELVV